MIWPVLAAVCLVMRAPNLAVLIVFLWLLGVLP